MNTSCAQDSSRVDRSPRSMRGMHIGLLAIWRIFRFDLREWPPAWWINEGSRPATDSFLRKPIRLYCRTISVSALAPWRAGSASEGVFQADSALPPDRSTFPNFLLLRRRHAKPV